MLGEFFEWWGRQLLELVPRRLRGETSGGDGLIVDATQQGLLTLLARRRGTEGRIGQIRLDEKAQASLRQAVAGRAGRDSLRLRLPGATVLERSVTLPLAAERDLERVLGYEMERLTPFTAAEVFWGFATEERDRARARLALRLTHRPASHDPGLDRPALLRGPAPCDYRGAGDGRHTHHPAEP